MDRAFQLALGRAPDRRAERALLCGFLQDGPLSEFALASFLLNDFLYVQ